MVQELKDEYDIENDFYEEVLKKYQIIRNKIDDYLKEFSPWLSVTLPDPIINDNVIDFPTLIVEKIQ